MFDQANAFLNVLFAQTGLTHVTPGNGVMMVIGIALIAIAVAKHVEPLLLAGIGFACIIANLPVSLSGASGVLPLGGGLFHDAYLGIAQLIIPPLIFLGLGAMTDFGAVIANPRLLLLGAGAQLGVFAAWVLAKSIGFTAADAGAIGIVGAADGPVALFVAAKLAPHLLGPVSVIAYASIALLLMVQTRAMRLFIAMGLPERARGVTRLEKIAFPVAIAIIFGVIFPQIAPLMAMLTLGNLLRELGPAKRVSKVALGLTKTLTVILAVGIGSSMTAETFLTVQTGKILLLGLAALACAVASSVAAAKLMTLFFKAPVSSSTGSTHPSPALMVRRGFKIAAQQEASNAILSHHPMGQNMAGVFGAAISGAIILAAFGDGQNGLSEIASGTLNGAFAFGILAFGLTIAGTLGLALLIAALPLLDRAGPFLSGMSARRQPSLNAAEQTDDAIPESHVAAVSAIMAAIVGAHRIVRIEPAFQGPGWQAEGRAAHHGSHTVFHPGAAQRQPDNEGNRHGTDIQSHNRRPSV